MQAVITKGDVLCGGSSNSMAIGWESSSSLQAQWAVWLVFCGNKLCWTMLWSHCCLTWLMGSGRNLQAWFGWNADSYADVQMSVCWQKGVLIFASQAGGSGLGTALLPSGAWPGLQGAGTWHPGSVRISSDSWLVTAVFTQRESSG